MQLPQSAKSSTQSIVAAEEAEKAKEKEKEEMQAGRQENHIGDYGCVYDCRASVAAGSTNTITTTTTTAEYLSVSVSHILFFYRWHEGAGRQSVSTHFTVASLMSRDRQRKEDWLFNTVLSRRPSVGRQVVQHCRDCISSRGNCKWPPLLENHIFPRA